MLTRAYNIVTVVVLCSVLALAQARTLTRLERQAIARAKQTPVSQLDAKLPQEVSLARFLQTEAGPGGSVQWDANDCGEQTGSAADRGRDFPICAEATAKLQDGRSIILWLGVGTYHNGISGEPGIVMLLLQNPDLSSENLKSLSDLPLKLTGIKGPPVPRELRRDVRGSEAKKK